jgi:hypothetical protein
VVRRDSASERGRPTYLLAEFKAAVVAGTVKFGVGAVRGLGCLEFDVDDARVCLMALDSSDFYKSSPPKEGHGGWRDIYKTTYLGRAIYVKITRAGDGPFLVESFKTDTGGWE